MDHRRPAIIERARNRPWQWLVAPVPNVVPRRSEEKRSCCSGKKLFAQVEIPVQQTPVRLHQRLDRFGRSR
jgi:hypothetical protein